MRTPQVEGYPVPAGCCDELLDAAGSPLPHAAGITFEIPGGNVEPRDRPFPLDLVPRVLTAVEWTTIKRGLAQRIRALNARHYPDVPPIKGVYRGAANAELDASVTMTRLESVDPASLARS